MKTVLVLLAIAAVAVAHGVVPVYQVNYAYPQYNKVVKVPQTIYKVPQYYYPSYKFVYPSYGTVPVVSGSYGTTYYTPLHGK